MSKTMTRTEIRLLQVIPQQLEGLASAEPVLADLLRLVASWMGSPSRLGFEAFAKLYLQEGNAKSAVAGEILREVFGVDGSEA